MAGWLDGWLGGWMDGWMDYICSFFKTSTDLCLSIFGDP